jgi:hypothetical protein
MCSNPLCRACFSKRSVYLRIQVYSVKGTNTVGGIRLLTSMNGRIVGADDIEFDDVPLEDLRDLDIT